MIDAYEVNTYRTLKETICDDPSLSLESVIDSLFATNEYATYPYVWPSMTKPPY